MPTIPEDLIDQIGNCVLFAGPGISIPAGDCLGPPGPALLSLELAARLEAQLDDFSLPWVAQCYGIQNGLHELHNYVANRLNDKDYMPNQAHYLLAQFPLEYLVYTAQDRLMAKAFERCGVGYNYVIDDAGLGSRHQRLTLIQLYGCAEQPDTLRLTEDERRLIVSKSPDLMNTLRTEAKTGPPVFIGYALNDRTFREFYYELRPEVNERSPRAYIVQFNVTENDLAYWGKRSALIVRMDAAMFLQKFAEALAGLGKIAVPLKAFPDEPVKMSAEEHQRRDRVLLQFSKQLGLGASVESRDQLAPVISSNILTYLHQAWTEHNLTAAATSEANMGQKDVREEAYKAKILLQQGNIEWGEGNLERAREDFEQAIRYDGSLKDAHLSLYYLLVECGEYEEALKKYRQNLVLDSALALLPPSFEIQSILGQTNVGISYCATETGRDKPVAVTVLRRSSGFPAETLNEIVEELKCIHSPYISPFLGLDRYNGRTYIVTEFIPGDILRKRIGGGQQMPLPEAMQIANQVAQALEAGALCGVPHRNLEPDNIVLKSPEAAVLVNFGFSRLERLPGSKLLTTTRSDYTSPEQRAGNPGDTRSDIYALGTILFEMLTGWLPGVSTAKQVSEVNPTVSEAVDILIAHAREIDPASRFQTVADMRRELQRIMLSSRQGWPGQYLRLALARTSALYTSLFSRQGLPVILAIVLFFLAAEGINQAFLVSLRGATRLILLLLIDSLAASAIGYYIVREVARQKGLGSLIFSGRGLGASFGWAFTLFLVRTTDFRGVRFGDIGRGDFAGYVFLNLAVTILMTYIAISLIRAAASLTEKWQRRYPLGFYWGYVFLFALVLLLALLRFPFGIFKF